MKLSFNRFYGVRPRLEVFTNLNSRLDREAMGVTYINFQFWAWFLDVSWKNRHWIDECPTVGERGVW